MYQNKYVKRRRKLFILSGPSGVGRTSIINSILNSVKEIDFSISYTTRKPREGEVNHVDYHFVSEQEFESLIEDDQLLEWAKVFTNYYGTSKEEVRKKLEGGKDVILDIDVQGASQVMNKASEEFGSGVFIFLAPPSMDELSKRLRERGTEDAEQLKIRLSKASAELESLPKFDYLVINDRLSQAVSLVKSIIHAERSKIDNIIDFHGC